MNDDVKLTEVADEREPAEAEVADPIRLALTWFTLSIAIIMTGFTGADLASGDQATSLWIGMAAWPVTAVIAGYIIRREAVARRAQRG